MGGYYLKKYSNNTIINIVTIIILILGFIYISFKYNIPNQNLENQVLVILKDKMISHEIFCEDKPLTGNETIEIINSEQIGNIKVFTGKIITENQPVIYMVVFKKHFIFNTYKYDYLIASTQFGSYMGTFTSYGLIKYIFKLNYDNFDISIERTPEYSRIIFWIFIFSGYIIQKIRMKKQNSLINKKEYIISE